MFSVRLVKADHYMSAPIPGLDVRYSEFRAVEVKQVPVIRIFGSNVAGQKVCLHIHGVFPYLYIPYDGIHSKEKFMYQIASALDKALNVSLGNSNSHTQHVYKVAHVSAIPFYGYHSKAHQFLKIYFYNPLMVKKASDLLQSGVILGQIFQPHETHLPFILQFCIDYNLHGMNLVHLSTVRFRQGTLEGTEVQNNSLHGIPEELMLPKKIVRTSTCSLEVDAVAADIVNQKEVSGQLSRNPGLQSIWDEEKERRRGDSNSSQFTPNNSQLRVAVPSASEIFHLDRLKKRLGITTLLKEKPKSSFESSPDGDNLKPYPAQTPEGETLLDASFLVTHVNSLNNDEKISSNSLRGNANVQEQNVKIDENVIITMTSQGEMDIDSSQSSSLNSQCLSFLHVLQDLVEEDSVLGSQHPTLDDIEHNEGEEDEMHQTVNVENCDEQTFRSPTRIISNEDQPCCSTSRRDAFFLPQLDGANDVFRDENSEQEKDMKMLKLNKPSMAELPHNEELECVVSQIVNDNSYFPCPMSSLNSPLDSITLEKQDIPSSDLCSLEGSVESALNVNVSLEGFSDEGMCENITLGQCNDQSLEFSSDIYDVEGPIDSCKTKTSEVLLMGDPWLTAQPAASENDEFMNGSLTTSVKDSWSSEVDSSSWLFHGSKYLNETEDSAELNLSEEEELSQFESVLLQGTNLEKSSFQESGVSSSETKRRLSSLIKSRSKAKETQGTDKLNCDLINIGEINDCERENDYELPPFGSIIQGSDYDQYLEDSCNINVPSVLCNVGESSLLPDCVFDSDLKIMESPDKFEPNRSKDSQLSPERHKVTGEGLMESSLVGVSCVSNTDQGMSNQLLNCEPTIYPERKRRGRKPKWLKEIERRSLSSGKSSGQSENEKTDYQLRSRSQDSESGCVRNFEQNSNTRTVGHRSKTEMAITRDSSHTEVPSNEPNIDSNTISVKEKLGLLLRKSREKSCGKVSCEINYDSRETTTFSTNPELLIDSSQFVMCEKETNLPQNSSDMLGNQCGVEQEETSRILSSPKKCIVESVPSSNISPVMKKDKTKPVRQKDLFVSDSVSLTFKDKVENNVKYDDFSEGDIPKGVAQKGQFTRNSMPRIRKKRREYCTRDKTRSARLKESKDDKDIKVTINYTSSKSLVSGEVQYQGDQQKTEIVFDQDTEKKRKIGQYVRQRLGKLVQLRSRRSLKCDVKSNSKTRLVEQPMDADDQEDKKNMLEPAIDRKVKEVSSPKHKTVVGESSANISLNTDVSCDENTSCKNSPSNSCPEGSVITFHKNGSLPPPDSKLPSELGSLCENLIKESEKEWLDYFSISPCFVKLQHFNMHSSQQISQGEKCSVNDSCKSTETCLSKNQFAKDSNKDLNKSQECAAAKELSCENKLQTEVSLYDDFVVKNSESCFPKPCLRLMPGKIQSNSEGLHSAELNMKCLVPNSPKSVSKCNKKESDVGSLKAVVQAESPRVADTLDTLPENPAKIVRHYAPGGGIYMDSLERETVCLGGTRISEGNIPGATDVPLSASRFSINKTLSDSRNTTDFESGLEKEDSSSSGLKDLEISCDMADKNCESSNSSAEFLSFTRGRNRKRSLCKDDKLGRKNLKKCNPPPGTVSVSIDNHPRNTNSVETQNDNRERENNEDACNVTNNVSSLVSEEQSKTESSLKKGHRKFHSKRKELKHSDSIIEGSLPENFKVQKLKLDLSSRRMVNSKSSLINNSEVSVETKNYSKDITREEALVGQLSVENTSQKSITKTLRDKKYLLTNFHIGNKSVNTLKSRHSKRISLDSKDELPVAPQLQDCPRSRRKSYLKDSKVNKVYELSMDSKQCYSSKLGENGDLLEQKFKKGNDMSRENKLLNHCDVRCTDNLKEQNSARVDVLLVEDNPFSNTKLKENDAAIKNKGSGEHESSAKSRTRSRSKPRLKDHEENNSKSMRKDSYNSKMRVKDAVKENKQENVKESLEESVLQDHSKSRNKSSIKEPKLRSKNLSLVEKKSANHPKLKNKMEENEADNVNKLSTESVPPYRSKLRQKIDLKEQKSENLDLLLVESISDSCSVLRRKDEEETKKTNRNELSLVSEPSNFSNLRTEGELQEKSDIVDLIKIQDHPKLQAKVDVVECDRENTDLSEGKGPEKNRLKLRKKEGMKLRRSEIGGILMVESQLHKNTELKNDKDVKVGSEDSTVSVLGDSLLQNCHKSRTEENLKEKETDSVDSLIAKSRQETSLTSRTKFVVQVNRGENNDELPVERVSQSNRRLKLKGSMKQKKSEFKDTMTEEGKPPNNFKLIVGRDFKGRKLRSMHFVESKLKKYKLRLKGDVKETKRRTMEKDSQERESQYHKLRSKVHTKGQKIVSKDSVVFENKLMNDPQVTSNVEVLKDTRTGKLSQEKEPQNRYQLRTKENLKEQTFECIDSLMVESKLLSNPKSRTNCDEKMIQGNGDDLPMASESPNINLKTKSNLAKQTENESQVGYKFRARSISKEPVKKKLPNLSQMSLENESSEKMDGILCSPVIENTVNYPQKKFKKCSHETRVTQDNMINKFSKSSSECDSGNVIVVPDKSVGRDELTCTAKRKVLSLMSQSKFPEHESLTSETTTKSNIPLRKVDCDGNITKPSDIACRNAHSFKNDHSPISGNYHDVNVKSQGIQENYTKQGVRNREKNIENSPFHQVSETTITASQSNHERESGRVLRRRKSELIIDQKSERRKRNLCNRNIIEGSKNIFSDTNSYLDFLLEPSELLSINRKNRRTRASSVPPSQKLREVKCKKMYIPSVDGADDSSDSDDNLSLSMVQLKVIGKRESVRQDIVSGSQPGQFKLPQLAATVSDANAKSQDRIGKGSSTQGSRQKKTYRNKQKRKLSDTPKCQELLLCCKTSVSISKQELFNYLSSEKWVSIKDEDVKRFQPCLIVKKLKVNSPEKDNAEECISKRRLRSKHDNSSMCSDREEGLECEKNEGVLLEQHSEHPWEITYRCKQHGGDVTKVKCQQCSEPEYEDQMLNESKTQIFSRDIVIANSRVQSGQEDLMLSGCVGTLAHGSRLGSAEESCNNDRLKPILTSNNSFLNPDEKDVSSCRGNNLLPSSLTLGNCGLSQKHNVNIFVEKDKVCKIFTLNKPPPSNQEVMNSLKLHSLQLFRNLEPFFGNPLDVTEKKEVGFKDLKISCHSVNEVEEFESTLNIRGLQTLRESAVLSLWGQSQSSFSLYDQISRPENMKAILASQRETVLTISTDAPSVDRVKKWINKRKKLKELESDKESELLHLYDNMEGNNEVLAIPLSSQQLMSNNVDKLSQKSTSPVEMLDKALNMKVSHNINDSFHVDLSGTINSSTAAEVKNGKQKIHSAATCVSDSQNSQEFSSQQVGNKSNLEESLNISLSQWQLTTPHHALLSRDSLGYKLSYENLQDCRAVLEPQYLTLLAVEIHAETRGGLRPDPAYDPVCAIFYCVQNDVPENSNIPSSLTGVIIDCSSRSGKNNSLTHNMQSSCEIKFVSDERSLMNEVVQLVRFWDPDILAGYEVEMSSWGYLFERAFVLELNLCSMVSRIPGTRQSTKVVSSLDESVMESPEELSLLGRIVLNVWRLMRHEVALQSYTFENISFHVLHERVPLVSYKTLTQWWRHRTNLFWGRVVEHYLFRVEGLIRIIKQLDLINRTSELARIFGIQFYEVLSRGSQFRVESMMLRLARPMNYIPVSPSVQQRANMRAPEYLQLIMEPESKLYVDPVIVLDFQSLYPSMIIAYNYCYSTCLGRVEHLGQSTPFEFGCSHLLVPPDEVKSLLNDINISPCGVVFVKPNVRKGVLPRMLEEILETRLMVKATMKKHKSDKTLQRVLHSRQLGLKLIANVTYGYTAANFSGRMSCVEVGDSVVSKGRETLERAIQLVENTSKWSARVVYGDTDSMFVLVPGRSREEAFKIGAEIAEAVTLDNPTPVKLKLEKVYQPCLLQTKKRYVGYMYESASQKEPIYDAKGIETVRRDGCPAVAKILEKSLRLLFETKDVSKVKIFAQRKFSKLLEGQMSLQDLIFAREYRGRSGYKPGACVPALELAKRWTMSDPRAEPRVSERVPYVIISGAPNIPLIQLVRSPHEVLMEPGLHINAHYYISRVLCPSLARCFSLLGADVHSWYKDLPRRMVLSLPKNLSINERKKFTISQYFSTVNCAICFQICQDGICDSCQEQPQKSSVILAEKLSQWERNLSSIEKICQSCCLYPENVECTSLDCPVLYRRIKARHTMSQEPFLRHLLENIW